MNIPAAITLSCVSLGFGGVAAWFALAPAEVRAGTDSAAVDLAPRDDSAERLTALEGAVRELGDRIALASAPAATRSAVEPVSDAAIEAAVAAWFEAHGNAVPEAVAAADTLGFETAEEAAALLANAGPEAYQSIWKRLVEEGLDDEVLALFEAAAEAAPNDPEAQLALGQAYLGRLQEASGPEMGKWAMKADGAFDAALESDPEHWEARYTKAMALSFWPPIFGKQNQAIAEFNTLVAQQAGQAPRPEHAQTHLNLGNMYQQTGQLDKALEAWRAGLELFPNDEALRQQIALIEANR